MNNKELEQTENTKKFIEEAKTLKKTGVIKAYQEIVDAINWSKTSLSNVINGRENISDYKYNEFRKVYGAVEVTNLQGLTAESLIRLDAMSTVILSALAEVLAFQRNQSVTKVHDDLVSTVNSQVKQRLDKLK